MSKANVFECRLSLKPAQQGGARVPPFCQEEEDKAKIQKELSILTDRHLTRHLPGGSQLDIKQTLGDGRPVGDNPKSKITPERFKVNISISKPPTGKIFCIFCGLLDCWAYQPSQLRSYTLLRPPEGEWKPGAQDPGPALAAGPTQYCKWIMDHISGDNSPVNQWVILWLLSTY